MTSDTAEECPVTRPPLTDGAPAAVDAPPDALGAGCGVIAVPGDSDDYVVSVNAGESFRVASLSLDPDLAGLDAALINDSGAAVASTALGTLPLAASIDGAGLLRLRVGSERSPGTGRYALQFTFGRD